MLVQWWMEWGCLVVKRNFLLGLWILCMDWVIGLKGALIDARSSGGERFDDDKAMTFVGVVSMGLVWRLVHLVGLVVAELLSERVMCVGSHRWGISNVELRNEIQVFEWDLLVCHGGWRNWRSEWWSEVREWRYRCAFWRGRERKFCFKEHYMPRNVNFIADLVKTFVGMMLWRVAKKDTRSVAVIKFMIWIWTKPRIT